MAEVVERPQVVPDRPTLETCDETITLAIEGTSCTLCALRTERGLKKLPGVAFVKGSLRSIVPAKVLPGIERRVGALPMHAAYVAYHREWRKVFNGRDK